MPNWIIIYLMFFLAAVALGLIFHRKVRNAYVRLRHYKRFVVVHMRFPETQFEEIYYVLPNEKEQLTQVKDRFYALRPELAIFEWKGRLHYIINYNDTDPVSLHKKTKEELELSAEQIQVSLKARPYEFIYAAQKNWALILCAVALVISLAVAIWATQTISPLSEKLDILLNNQLKLAQDITVIKK